MILNNNRSGNPKSWLSSIIAEGKIIRHISFYSTLIETMGYDPLTAILEVRLWADGKIRRYEDVPEDIWYRLRLHYHPDTYFRAHVCGHYEETMVEENGENVGSR